MPRLAYAYEGRAKWENDVDIDHDWPGKHFGLEHPTSATPVKPSKNSPLGPHEDYWFLRTAAGKPLAAVNIDAELGWLLSGVRFELATAERDQFLSGLGL